MTLRDELNSSLAKLAVKQEAMYKLEEAKENLWVPLYTYYHWVSCNIIIVMKGERGGFIASGPWYEVSRGLKPCLQGDWAQREKL